jgi:DNA mismatch repair ATPase MutS
MNLVLFFRVGSFYELFYEDAELGIQLGLRACGSHYKCGVPVHHFALYATRMLAHGHLVGRVEEFPDPKSTLLARRLVRIYTPATALGGVFAHARAGTGTGYATDEALPKPLLAVVEGRSGMLGLCLIDVLSSVMHTAFVLDTPGRPVLHTVLRRENPAEVVLVTGNPHLDTTECLHRYVRYIISDHTYMHGT